MLKPIEDKKMRSSGSDRAHDWSASVTRDDDQWWQIQYKLLTDDDCSTAYLPPTLSIVETAALAAHNAEMERLRSQVAELEAQVEVLRELLPSRQAEAATTLVSWVGNGGRETRTISITKSNGYWYVRRADENTFSDMVGDTTLYSCMQKLYAQSETAK